MCSEGPTCRPYLTTMVAKACPVALDGIGGMRNVASEVRERQILQDGFDFNEVERSQYRDYTIVQTYLASFEQ